MATFLDIGLIGIAAPIFAFLLFFIITYGFLMKSKPFGDQNGLYALIAVAIGFIVLISDAATFLLLFMTPWFFVLIFIGFFILFILMMFGLKEKDLTAGATSELRTWAIILTVVILIFGLGQVFGQTSLEAGGFSEGQPTPAPEPQAGSTSVSTDDFGTNVVNTLINPKVLGLIAIMLVAIFSMFLLTRTQVD
ncbi:MAG: hypothetical protein ACMXX9_00035 [Candidatus Woesearchaeota archaeon]